MQNYGVTEKGFVLKRMDVILDEIHSDLSAGFGVDTRALKPSFLDVIVTTFAGKIAELWEVAQNNYYSKIPSMATGLNLDNAVQYGGIKREPDRRSLYRLHCTGDDGTIIRENTFESGLYSIGINGQQYSFFGNGVEDDILNGLKNAINNDDYTISIAEKILKIEDKTIGRNNALTLSGNLTTKSVTTIADFLVQEYGRISVAKGTVNKIVNNVTGFRSVENRLEAVYFGRLRESDVELRQSYIAKSALRSNTMIDSIVAELLNNVSGVENAAGYENSEDTTDERGLPPHSIEIIVQGGEEQAIAEAILKRKAGGIKTHGNIAVPVNTKYGDVILVKFNRPEKLYVWLKVKLKGNKANMPSNYTELVKKSIIDDAEQLSAGQNLQSQLLFDGIYRYVSGVEHIKILVATSTSAEHIPSSGEYAEKNISVSHRQIAEISNGRIEVLLNAGD